MCITHGHVLALPCGGSVFKLPNTNMCARVVCLSARVRKDSGDIRGCRTGLGFVCISFPRDDHARVLMWLAAHTIIGFRLDFDVQPQRTCFTWTLSVDTGVRLVAKRAGTKATRAKAYFLARYAVRDRFHVFARCAYAELRCAPEQCSCLNVINSLRAFQL